MRYEDAADHSVAGFFCIHQVNYIDDIAMSWCGVAVTPPGPCFDKPSSTTHGFFYCKILKV